jgi:hypothetical protein
VFQDHTPHGHAQSENVTRSRDVLYASSRAIPRTRERLTGRLRCRPRRGHDARRDPAECHALRIGTNSRPERTTRSGPAPRTALAASILLDVLAVTATLSARRRNPRALGCGFFIGAHARTRADRLVTRDRGFFRRYFDGLEIIDPTG